MGHALIDRLFDEYGYTKVTLENHETFIEEPGLTVLFFPGDPTTVKDATDVAVVLPELVKAFDGRLRPGVVTDTFGDAKSLKTTYGFSYFPALVFLRDGEYVGTITRIQDWSDYLTQINEFLVVAPSRPPGFSIPVVSA